MVQRKGGNRSGTRQIMRKKQGTHGKFSLRRYLQILSAGEKVALVAESSIHKGLYFKRFHGRVATVKGRRGFCYEVEIKDGNKEKTLIVHPVHLKRLN